MSLQEEMIVEIALLILVAFCIFGCGKKEKQMPAVQGSSASQAGVLPELEQNKIFFTNHPVNAEPPDYSYHETHDNLQPLPAGVETLSPPAD